MVQALVLRRPRRTFLIGLALLTLLPAYTALRASAPVHAISSGNAYSVPQVVDTNPAPDIVETTITAEAATVDIGNGVTAHVLTFNGAIPGPEFRLHVNDTVIVHFVNNLVFPTGIHWHGIEDDNASDGTPLTQNLVDPGDKFLYKFKVPRPGVFWYHPHHHSSTNQVFKGMYGSLIVTEPAEATLQANNVLPPQANTKSLVLGDMTVCKTPGSNDLVTYDPSLPWAGGGPLPVQFAPHPTDLCDKPIDEDGAPIESPPGTPVPLNAGDVPNIQRTSGPSNEGQTVLTNGKNVGGRAGDPSAPGALAAGAETLAVTPGTGLRMQIINTAPIRYMRLRLTDSAGTQIKLVVVGGEGGLLDEAVTDGTKPLGYEFDYADGEIVLGPGERTDVVAAFPSSATGVATLWTLDFKRQGIGGNGGQRFTNIPTVPVAHFAMTGSPPVTPYTITAGTQLLTNPSVGGSVEVLPAPTGGFLDPSTFTPAKVGMPSQDIQLTATGSGSDTGINAVKGIHDFSGIDYTVAPKVGSSRYAALVGQTLELTVTNTTEAHHPFHPHGFSMQPLTFEKPLGTVVFTFPHEFQDTVDVPNKTTLRYRVRLDDRPLMDGVTLGGATGRWVFHCHIFFHAVFGMLSEIIVTDASGNERPYVNADDVETAEVDNVGDTATMHGTLHDTDGDAVALTASKGTVVNNNDGTWDWSYTLDNSAGQAGLVYITGTDPGGKKDQAAFELIVNPLSALSDAHLWVGLKNSDDQGTQFDVMTELLINGQAVTSGLTRCVTGLTRNAAKAKEVVVPWTPFSPVSVSPGDVLSLRVSTRIGTLDATGAKCSGPGGSHNNAVGLRLYYDASNRDSHFDTTLGPNANVLQFLHSDGGLCDKPTATTESKNVTTRFLDSIAPPTTSVKCKDSAGVNFAGGNVLKELSVWSLN